MIAIIIVTQCDVFLVPLHPFFYDGDVIVGLNSSALAIMLSQQASVLLALFLNVKIALAGSTARHVVVPICRLVAQNVETQRKLMDES